MKDKIRKFSLNKELEMIKILSNSLPIVIVFETREGIIKEYVLKTGKKGDVLVLNKKD